MKSLKRLVICLLLCMSVLAVPVTAHAAVKLNKKSVSLYKDHTEKLTLTGASGKVKWSTSNKKIASIKVSGKSVKVTGVANGTAKITATYQGKKYTCKVKVTTRKHIMKVSKKKLTIPVSSADEDDTIVRITYLEDHSKVYYLTNHAEYVGCQWGEWVSRDVIELHVFGRKKGSARVKIFNDYNDEVTYIDVTVK